MMVPHWTVGRGTSDGTTVDSRGEVLVMVPQWTAGEVLAMVPHWTAGGGTSDGTTVDSWGEGVDGANQRNCGKGNDTA